MTKVSNPSTFRLYYSRLLHTHANLFTYEERKELKSLLKKYYESQSSAEIPYGHSLMDKLCIIDTLLNEIGLGRAAVLGVLLQELVENKQIESAEIDLKFQTSVSGIIQGMSRVRELYERNTSIETENFRKLFLTFAEDIRVILIIIAEHLQMMRTLDAYNSDNRQNVARESSFLYAPLAHRMGLYAIKPSLRICRLIYKSRNFQGNCAEIK